MGHSKVNIMNLFLAISFVFNSLGLQFFAVIHWAGLGSYVRHCHILKRIIMIHLRYLVSF